MKKSLRKKLSLPNRQSLIVNERESLSKFADELRVYYYKFWMSNGFPDEARKYSSEVEHNEGEKKITEASG